MPSMTCWHLLNRPFLLHRQCFETPPLETPPAPCLWLLCGITVLHPRSPIPCSSTSTVRGGFASACKHALSSWYGSLRSYCLTHSWTCGPCLPWTHTHLPRAAPGPFHETQDGQQFTNHCAIMLSHVLSSPRVLRHKIMPIL